jgi:hypothetical protein
MNSLRRALREHAINVLRTVSMLVFFAILRLERGGAAQRS